MRRFAHGQAIEPLAASVLPDGRSRRVIFLSHCLLNENVRYAGGATRPGAVDELIDAAQAAGVGICQMPCPEQLAWGGVSKRRLMLAFGADRRGLRSVRRLITPLFLAYTRRRYARPARQVVASVADYQRSGYHVLGIVGVDGSPSCGVHLTLDIDRAADALAACDPATTDTTRLNDRVVSANTVPGPGLLTAAIRGESKRRGLTVPLFAHDLVDELAGRQDVSPALRAALER
jgi:predicted secreted protein